MEEAERDSDAGVGHAADGIHDVELVLGDVNGDDSGRAGPRAAAWGVGVRALDGEEETAMRAYVNVIVDVGDAGPKGAGAA